MHLTKADGRKSCVAPSTRRQALLKNNDDNSDNPSHSNSDDSMNVNKSFVSTVDEGQNAREFFPGSSSVD